MINGLGIIPIPEVSWDVVEVNKRVAALNGNWEGVNPRDIYPDDTYAMLTNQVLTSRWEFKVVSKYTFDVGDALFCKTCTTHFEMNYKTTFKRGADILMEALAPILKEEFNDCHPDSIVITGKGFIQLIGSNHAKRNRSRSKTRPKS